jgi:hypothetical protein
MTDPKELVIQRAGDADGPAIARLRRAWTQEQQAREPGTGTWQHSVLRP